MEIWYTFVGNPIVLSKIRRYSSVFVEISYAVCKKELPLGLPSMQATFAVRAYN